MRVILYPSTTALAVFCQASNKDFHHSKAIVALLPQALVAAELEEGVNQTDLGVTRNKIMTAQYECYQKIMQDPIQQTEGSCNLRQMN